MGGKVQLEVHYQWVPIHLRLDFLSGEFEIPTNWKLSHDVYKHGLLDFLLLAAVNLSHWTRLKPGMVGTGSVNTTEPCHTKTNHIHIPKLCHGLNDCFKFIGPAMDRLYYTLPKRMESLNFLLLVHALIPLSFLSRWSHLSYLSLLSPKCNPTSSSVDTDTYWWRHTRSSQENQVQNCQMFFNWIVTQHK